jgi:hypothetical protein
MLNQVQHDGKEPSAADRLGRDIADAAIGAITPGPAAAHVQHADFVAGTEFGKRLGVIVGLRQELRAGNQMPHQRIGIVGGNDRAGERGIGEILAIGVGEGVRQVRNPAENESFKRPRRRVLCCAGRMGGAGLRPPRRRGIF